MDVLRVESSVVQVHGGKEILRDTAIDETTDEAKALATEDDVGTAARSRPSTIPPLQNRAVEISVLLTKRVVGGDADESLGGLYKSNLPVDRVLSLLILAIEVGDKRLQELGLADHVTIKDNHELAIGLLRGEHSVVKVSSLGMMVLPWDLATSKIFEGYGTALGSHNPLHISNHGFELCKT